MSGEAKAVALQRQLDSQRTENIRLDSERDELKLKVNAPTVSKHIFTLNVIIFSIPQPLYILVHISKVLVGKVEYVCKQCFVILLTLNGY